MRNTSKTLGPTSKMALGARRVFKILHQKPGKGFEDAPRLPVLPQDRFWHMNMKAGPLGYLTACLAMSLEANGYNMLHHPKPVDYVRGLMACSTLPQAVRTDPEMLRRFPPQKLEGLDEATLIWSPSERSGQKQAA